MNNDDLRILRLLSRYLNDTPDYITPEMVSSLAGCGVSSEEAFSLLMAAAMGLDIDESESDRALYRAYFPRMLHKLSGEAFACDPYYANIRLQGARIGRSELKRGRCKPYEAFVCDDIIATEDGRHIPQIGYFPEGLGYPAVFEDGRLWMSVTPNEINTMREPIEKARGRVLSFGLGLGYFAYMASEKASVSSVTVVEQNPDVIALFREFILPQFGEASKLTIVRADAFEYAREHFPRGECDFVFTDLWHDVSDGLPMYMRMRSLAPLAPDAEHMYWIEKTMRWYI